MDSKTLFLAVVMMYIVDVSHALMCYNCTQDLSSQNPVCGQTLGDTSTIHQVPCSSSCMVAKSSMSVMDTILEVYVRWCQEYCMEDCMEIEGVTTCIKCCKTDLCNSNYVDTTTQPEGGAQPEGSAQPEGDAQTEDSQPEPEHDITAPTVNDMTPKSGAINVVVNFATVFFTALLSATLF